ncbi:cupin domain-containing protein [Veronia pacifica]|uniref:Cupin type-1 domain-containing protein n=1 Tax=Veronia pacifica TaxID=1080227 RepID=A0A1C3ESI2_9GAMM|nr:cupin domain-containing protein [Veronia pacifica]ODA36168.1 hypothetical protein A8L45_00770 [Veronia pacifica]
MKLLPFFFLSLLASNQVYAETRLIDLDLLPSKTVYEVAKVTPLAVSDGKPSVILFQLPSGKVVPPHSTQSGIRLMTVISGKLFWGNGEKVNKSEEKVYEAGDILTVPEKDPHWLAARQGDVILQLVSLKMNEIAPGIRKQM